MAPKVELVPTLKSRWRGRDGMIWTVRHHRKNGQVEMEADDGERVRVSLETWRERVKLGELVDVGEP